MSKTKNRFVAGLLAFTLILTGMSGLNGIAMVNAATEDEATVTEVTCTPSNVSEKGGEIEVTVKGQTLATQSIMESGGFIVSVARSLTHE